MGKNTKRKTKWTTVKVPQATHELATALVAVATREGWARLNLAREGVPTIGSIIEEGINRLSKELSRG